MTELDCALTGLKVKHAFHFEEFAQKFLAIQYPNFKKFGENHDLGRDGVFENLISDPTIFMQASITDSFTTKIGDTIKKLRKNGFDVKVLVYCTNQRMAPFEEHLKIEAQSKYNVQLDIRGHEFFVTHAAASQGRMEISKQFVNKVIDNIQFNFGDSLSGDLSNEFKLFSAYLQNSALNAEKGISKTAFEGFVKCILASSGEMSIVEIRSYAATVFHKTNPGLFESRISGALERLRNQGIVNVAANGKYSLRSSEKKQIIDAVSRATSFNNIKSSLMVVLRDSAALTKDERDNFAELIINDALYVIENYIWTSGHFFVLVQSDSRTIGLHKASSNRSAPRWIRLERIPVRPPLGSVR